MSQQYSPDKFTCLRYFIGDVRDNERLERAMTGVNYVIHAAAMKMVPTAEYNPYECIKTNVFGAQNVVEAALDTGVEKIRLDLVNTAKKLGNKTGAYGASTVKLKFDDWIVEATGTVFPAVKSNTDAAAGVAGTYTDLSLIHI